MVEWKPVLGYEEFYEVSDDGQVRSISRSTTGYDGRTIFHKGQILKQTSEKRAGYRIVALSVKGQVKYRKVHHLVLETFVGLRPEGYECCHNDRDVSNNRVENLRWGTRSDNNQDRVRHGTHSFAIKEVCNYGHKLVEPNLYKRPNAKPQWRGQCKACNRTNSYISTCKRRGYEIPNFQALSDKKYNEIMASV